jgi:uncharacterized protein YfdQ (DUF2303 family)
MEIIRDVLLSGRTRDLEDGQRNAFAVLPGGYQVHDLEAVQRHPNRIVGSYSFRDVRSLADYLARFEAPHSIAFSDPDRFAIRVQIDHHEHGDGGEATPSHCGHTAAFIARFAPHYKLWRDIHGKPMSQVKAGEFLEERAVDLIEPQAADIMDMVMTFEALKKVEFSQSTRLHDGRRQFSYKEENEARGNVTLPERIRLRLPIFEGMEPDVVLVRVRYRIEDARLVFAFEIHDRDDVEMTAFERCEDALSAARPSLLLLRSAPRQP